MLTMVLDEKDQELEQTAWEMQYVSVVKRKVHFSTLQESKESVVAAQEKILAKP